MGGRGSERGVAGVGVGVVVKLGLGRVVGGVGSRIRGMASGIFGISSDGGLTVECAAGYGVYLWAAGK